METAQAAPSGATHHLDLRALPRWKLALLGMAAILVVAGLSLRVFAWASGGFRGTGAAGDEVRAHTLAGNSSSSFLPSGETVKLPRVGGEVEVRAQVGESSGEDWSPVLVRGGMSFIVGFCVGYALRAFARLSAVFAGLFFLALFGLAYAGVVEVHWNVLQEWFERATESLSKETAGFRTFISGSLPAAGAAAAGLVTGVKKR